MRKILRVAVVTIFATSALILVATFVTLCVAAWSLLT